MTEKLRRAGRTLLPALLAGACAGGVARAPVPVVAPASDADAPGVRVRTGYTAADVAFMQGMIGHHAQALVMAELVPERTTRENMRLLAERIDVSQRDEIAFMKRWLQDRGESLPADDAHVHAAMGHGELMPGMLTDADLQRLREARGTEFDRLFLQYMIRHHEGAIVVVDALFNSPGAGQEPELFVFASDVNADQTSEIRRMRVVLESLPAPDRR